MKDMASYVKERLQYNMDRILGADKIAVFPFGGAGKLVQNILYREYSISVDYAVDNYAADGERFEDFAPNHKNENLVVILATFSYDILYEIWESLLCADFSMKRVIVLCRDLLPAHDAFEFLLNQNITKLLDVGCGKGYHARILEDYGIKVTGMTTALNLQFGKLMISDVIYSDFISYPSCLLRKRHFDAVWISHVLEHIRDVNTFLDKVRELCDEGTCLAITVPSREANILLGHVQSFSAGRLLRYLLTSGFDCRDAMIKEYDGNLSIILPSVKFIPDYYNVRGVEELTVNKHSQNGIFAYLPSEIELLDWHGDKFFRGDIEQLNWYEGDYKHKL